MLKLDTKSYFIINLGISNVEHCTAKEEETDPIPCSRMSIIMQPTLKPVRMERNTNAK